MLFSKQILQHLSPFFAEVFIWLAIEVTSLKYGVTRRTKATASTGRANNRKGQRTKQKKENLIIFEQSILINKHFFGSLESVNVFC